MRIDRRWLGWVSIATACLGVVVPGGLFFLIVDLLPSTRVTASAVQLWFAFFCILLAVVTELGAVEMAIMGRRTVTGKVAIVFSGLLAATALGLMVFAIDVLLD
jgi:hypothetical protein